MSNEEFGRVRKALGIPQMRISREIGVGIWQINQFEKHGRPLTPEQLFKLQKWLDGKRALLRSTLTELQESAHAKNQS